MFSGHVLIMFKLPCIINDDYKFLSFGQSSCHLYMACAMSTVTKHDKWSYKSKKGTCHVFYMATPSHATESVDLHLMTTMRKYLDDSSFELILNNDNKSVASNF